MTDQGDGGCLRLGTPADQPALQALYRAHLEVLHGWNREVDLEGEIDQQWFDRPGVLFPWLIQDGGALAGFSLFGNHRLATAMDAQSDFYQHEFHVASTQRRRGLGRAAVAELRRQHPGTWTFEVLPDNGPAMGFWRACLPEAREVDWTSGDGVRFVRFLVPAVGEPSP